MKRPLLITIVCVVLALLWLLNLVSVAASFGTVSPGRFGWIVVTNLISGLSIVGLWRMQAWGPILYLGGQLIGIATWLAFPMAGAEDAFPLWALFIAPAIYAACVFPFWRQFKPLQVRRS